jgi:hypothetical protein
MDIFALHEFPVEPAIGSLEELLMVFLFLIVSYPVGRQALLCALRRSHALRGLDLVSFVIGLR